MNAIILKALAAGVHIDMYMLDGVIHYDVNSGAKSPVVLRDHEDEDKLVAELRYNERHVITDFDDLCNTVVHAMFHKDSVNHVWWQILTDRGLLPLEN